MRSAPPLLSSPLHLLLPVSYSSLSISYSPPSSRQKATHIQAYSWPYWGVPAATVTVAEVPMGSAAAVSMAAAAAAMVTATAATVAVAAALDRRIKCSNPPTAANANGAAGVAASAAFQRFRQRPQPDLQVVAHTYLRCHCPVAEAAPSIQFLLPLRFLLEHSVLRRLYPQDLASPNADLLLYARPRCSGTRRAKLPT